MRHLPLFSILFIIIFIDPNAAMATNQSKDRTLFIFGGDINLKFAQHTVDLTGKIAPRICFIPTASADSENSIKYWESICRQLNIDSHIMRVWVNSNQDTIPFEKTLLSMDALVVGGGNTLNMLAIWRAQGIDRILKEAYKRGIVLAGGSAGSICWNRNGISDSRPGRLSVVKGLSLLPYSNCPHYADSARKSMYHKEISAGNIPAGYASDDLAGIVFKNEKLHEAVSQSDAHNSYFVSSKGSRIVITQLTSLLLINKNAIAESAFERHEINRRLEQMPLKTDQNTALNAFINIKHMLLDGKLSALKSISSHHLQAKMLDNVSDRQAANGDARQRALNETLVDRVLTCGNRLAAIISHRGDFYTVWYFYHENNRWMNAGEDIGGQTVMEAEITFREKAPTHLKKLELDPVSIN